MCEDKVESTVWLYFFEFLSLFLDFFPLSDLTVNHKTLPMFVLDYTEAVAGLPDLSTAEELAECNAVPSKHTNMVEIEAVVWLFLPWNYVTFGPV